MLKYISDAEISILRKYCKRINPPHSKFFPIIFENQLCRTQEKKTCLSKLRAVFFPSLKIFFREENNRKREPTDKSICLMPDTCSLISNKCFMISDNSFETRVGWGLKEPSSKKFILRKYCSRKVSKSLQKSAKYSRIPQKGVKVRHQS